MKFSARVDEFLREAEERGDLYATTQLTLGSGLTWRNLAADKPDTTQQAIEEVIANWPISDFDLQHFWAYYSLTEVALYRSDGRRARSEGERRGLADN